MELRPALKEQYHAGLAMLTECVEVCPEDVWREGEDSRPFWKIAYHAAFYTHLYLGQNEESFQPWPGRRDGEEGDDQPEWVQNYQRDEILDYLQFIDRLVDPTLDRLDLNSDETGFSWYPDMSKLSHQIMNLRHLQGHVGQLSELLMAKGIDTDWVSKSGGLDH